MRARGLRSRIVVAVAASALLLAGCGGGTGEQETGSTAAEDGTETTEAAPSSTTEEAAEEADSAGENDSTSAPAEPDAAAGAGDFCATLEEFYQLSVITLFGLAFEPTPEVVEITLASAETGAQVRELAPAEIAGDLEPMIVLAEDLAAAMDGVDPADPAAVTAAAQSVPAYLSQDEELAESVDAYTEDACSFTANSVAEEMMSADAETAASSAAGSDSGTGSGSTGEADLPPVDCDRLDADAIVTALGGERARVDQLGGNPEFTYQLGEEEFHGSVMSCTVALGLSTHGPPEVRMRFVAFGDEFYPRYRELAQGEDAFAPVSLAGGDGFYFQETSFQAALVVDLSGGRALMISAGAGISEPAPDQAAMITVGEAALGAIG